VKALNKYLLIFSLLFSFCTPQKRLNRLVDRHPHLVELDTIKIIDTIIMLSYDTIVLNSVVNNDTTIIVNTERVLARYYYDTLRQEIWHEIECKTDTVYYEKLIPVDKIVYKELSFWEKYNTLIYIALGLFILLVVYKRLTK
tara:strand:- start:122 stop:547 length:426 start_codon:yes stop_codon:yes gene_type:complete